MPQPATPARPAVTSIVSLLPSATDMVASLGAADRLVGVSHECDHPQATHLPRLTRSCIDSRADSGDIDRQTQELLAAGRPLYELDEAQLRRLRPSVILTQAQCDVCAVRFEDVSRVVRRETVLADTVLVDLNPQTLDDVLRDIERVGAAIQCAERAAAYVAELRTRIARVAERTAGLPDRDRPRVACLEWLEPLMLAANWTPDLLSLAGGRCPLALAGRHSRPLTWDELRAFDPEIIVVMPCGFELSRTRTAARPLSRLPGWDQVSAVRRNAVHCVDGNLLFNRSGPRLVESLELLAHLVQPDLFAAGDVPRHAEFSAAFA